IRAQMDEAAVTAYLNSTGGIFCSFADVACPGSTGTVTDTTGVSGDWRYIETMYRRGYTKGCDGSNDGQRRFCPTRTLTRGEMAVFVIRAKMNSVFPTVTSGAFTTTSCQPPGTQVGQVGDQFGLFVGCSPYFSDVAATHPYFSFIQKMRELRISNGTTLSTATSLGTFTPEGTLTRGELMTFLVRAFFP
ncbi:MAG: S-layer homology domain-containing protein, partial [Bryobacterales bacterium]|nr:S-layer homology domain-containing protein [Bryobacterales bacterium]